MRKDKQDVLMWALVLRNRGNAVFLDTETTGLKSPHCVEWAIVDLNLMGVQGRTKPMAKITDGAIEVHGISNEDVENEVSFVEAWKIIEPIITNREIVIFNAPYDTEVIQNSAVAHRMPIGFLDKYTVHCAMRQYAIYHGERHPRYGTYKWQNLDAACTQMKIIVEGKAHSAFSDALATAKIVLRLAEIAEAELPEELRLQCLPTVPMTNVVIEG